MLNCRDVGTNASEFLAGTLPWRVNLAVIWHLMRCGNCRLALRQLLVLLRALRRSEPAPPSEAQIAAWMKALDAHRDHDHPHAH